MHSIKGEMEREKKEEKYKTEASINMEWKLLSVYLTAAYNLSIALESISVIVISFCNIIHRTRLYRFNWNEKRIRHLQSESDNTSHHQSFCELRWSINFYMHSQKIVWTVHASTYKVENWNSDYRWKKSHDFRLFSTLIFYLTYKNTFATTKTVWSDERKTKQKH